MKVLGRELTTEGRNMKIIDRAVQLNPDGMDASSIQAVHCPSWYGLPNIEGCPRTEYVGRKKTPIQVNTLCRCRECWNRELPEPAP